jgi:hypothetical protein
MSFLNNRIFLNKNSNEIDQIKNNEISEIEKYTSFDIMTLIEAMFRIDYCYRSENKLKDDLSRDFRAIYKIHARKASLAEHILAAWEKYNPDIYIFREINAVFKYRHWLAHGRYWLLRTNASRFDFKYLYAVYLQIITSFNLYQ